MGIIGILFVIIFLILYTILLLAATKMNLAPLAEFFNHGQMMSFYFDIPGIKWPTLFHLTMPDIMALLAAFGFGISFSDVASPQCFFPNFGYREKWLIGVGFPAGFIFVTLLFSIFGLPLIVKCKFAYRRLKKRIRKKLGLKEKEENSDSDSDDDDEFGFGTPKRSRNKRRSGLTKITPMTETDIKAAKSKKKNKKGASRLGNMIKARDKIYNEAHDNNKRREHERGLAKHRAREIAKKKREERRNKMRRQSVATKKGEKDFSFNDVVKQASKPAKLKTRGRQLSISGRNLERINQKFMMDQQKRQRTMDELHDESKQKALSRRELSRQKMRAKGLLKSQHKNKGMADVVTRKQSMGRDSAGVETGNSKSGGNSLDFARIVKTSKTVTRARSKIKGSAAADLVAERLKQRKKEEKRV